MSNPCEKHSNVKADGYCPVCLTDENADLRATVANLQERVSQFDSCIQAVADALGGACCGGVDGDQANPLSTTAVLVDAIANLRRQSKIMAELRDAQNECAKHFEEAFHLRTNQYVALRDQLADERRRVMEECARVCEELMQYEERAAGDGGDEETIIHNETCKECAAAIRALAAPQQSAPDSVEVPFKRETWPDVDGYGDAEGKPYLCEVCGTPVRYGSTHYECGTLTAAKEPK